MIHEDPRLNWFAGLHRNIKSRGRRIGSSPEEVATIQKEGGSELVQELHYAGVISPPFLGPAIASSGIARGEGLGFHG